MTSDRGEGRRRGRQGWRLPLSVLPPLLLLLVPLLGGAGLGRAAAAPADQPAEQQQQEQEQQKEDGGVDPAYYQEMGACVCAGCLLMA